MGSLNTPGSAYSIAVSGDYAYVADYDRGLRVIRISNADTLLEVAFLDTSGFSRDVAVNGGYAYLADSSPGLRVVDIADPEHPQVVGSFNTPGIATGVAVRNSLVFVADLNGGLRIIDVTVPSSPYPVGAFSGSTTAMEVAVAVTDSFVFVADDAYGLRVMRFSDPSWPQQTGYYNTPGAAYGLAVRRNLVFLADDSYFGIYDVTDAVTISRTPPQAVVRDFAVLRVYPNPFNSATTLQLNLPRMVQGRLVVYDITGRTVGVLLEGSLSAGQQNLRFDAGSLASGTYFVRLESSQYSAVQKLHLVR